MILRIGLFNNDWDYIDKTDGDDKFECKTVISHTTYSNELLLQGKFLFCTSC